MTRAGDLATPAVTLHPLEPSAPMGRWPWRPVIAVELLAQDAYTWDDADPAVVWDAPGDVYVYDAPKAAARLTDVTCDLISLTGETGEPDELGLFPPGRLEMTLANPVGAYSTYTADGRLVYMAPGRRIHVWAQQQPGIEQLWLWSGRVTRWAPQADGTVVVEGYTGVHELAEDVAAPWTPGTAAQLPRSRIQSIANRWRYADRVIGDVGLNPLLAPNTERSPWEEMQTVALSDGGIVANDADGSLYYRDRGWRVGRPDQATVPVFSDNVCTSVDAVIWDTELSADDDGLFNSIELVNTAGLTATAVADPSDPGAWYVGSEYRLTHPDPDLWTAQGAGNDLAAHLLAVSSIPAIALRQFALYLPDPQQDLWRIGLDRRLGDRVRFVHEQIGPLGLLDVLDVTLVLMFVRHEITADSWVATYSTTRAVGYSLAEQWDRTQFTYDDPDPANVWSY